MHDEVDVEVSDDVDRFDEDDDVEREVNDADFVGNVALKARFFFFFVVFLFLRKLPCLFVVSRSVD